MFRAETVTSMGQVIGIVLACDRATAQRAAKKVKVTYEDLSPIITIEVRLPNIQLHHGAARKLSCSLGVVIIESLIRYTHTFCRYLPVNRMKYQVVIRRLNGEMNQRLN